MNRPRPLTDEELCRILEESDGEENLVGALEDSECGEFLDENIESVENIGEYINVNNVEVSLVLPPADSSVTLQNPCMSSPDRFLPPLFENEPAVLPLPMSEEATFQPSMHEQAPTHSRTPRINFQILPTAWSFEIRPLEREVFTGYDNGKRQDQIFGKNTDLWTIFRSIVDDEMIRLMVTQTNIYAGQLQLLPAVKPHSRIKRWKDVSADEMLKFIGVYLFTGLVDFPTTECYWKKDRLYFHPLLHEISMSYDRFSLILRCWHFADNSADRNGRLYKIQPLIDKVIENSRKVFTPGDTVAVDESMVGFRGKLNIRTYNPQKSSKYGLKIYKLCTDTGYTWSYKVYSGEDTVVEGLDKPGSVVAALAQDVLNEGRLLVTDNYYTSVRLARYLKQRRTDFCGTVRKNRRDLPPDVVNATLKKGEIAVKQNSFLTVLKWKDQRDVLVMSTCHNHDMQMSTGYRPILKPKIVMEYNRGKKGIDVADQLASYNSPVRKTCFWYKKIAGDLMSICVINAVLIYKDLNAQSKVTVLKGHEIIIKQLLSLQFPAPSDGLSTPQCSSQPARSSRSSHSLTKIPRRDPKRIFRKRCTGCYKVFIEEGRTAAESARKAKKTDMECLGCHKAFCLNCFNRCH